jgi:hypothetical protein
VRSWTQTSAPATANSSVSAARTGKVVVMRA